MKMKKPQYIRDREDFINLKMVQTLKPYIMYNSNGEILAAFIINRNLAYMFAVTATV